MFATLCLILLTFASEKNNRSSTRSSVPYGYVYNYDVYNCEGKKQRFQKWLQNHEQEFPEHFCSVDYSRRCKFGIDLAADAVASCFMNRNIAIDPYKYMFRKTLENQLSSIQDQLSNIQGQLKSEEEVFINALVKGKEFNPSERRLSEEVTTDESSERLDEDDLKHLTGIRIHLKSFQQPKREKYKLSQALLNENFKTKYFDGKETIEQRRLETRIHLEEPKCEQCKLSRTLLNENFKMKYFDAKETIEHRRFELCSFEKSKDEVYKAHRNRLNAKREIIAEKKILHEKREHFESKMKKNKILYEISQSAWRTRNDKEMKDVTEYEMQNAEAQIKKKVKEPSVLKRLLENLQEMAPAQMRIHLAKFSDINPAKLKKEKLRKKLAQVLRDKLDALSSEKGRTAPEEQKNDAPKSPEERGGDCARVNYELAEFCQNEFTHATSGISSDGYIESTIHCGKAITCVYALEEIVRRFIYDNKEFRMSQITGPTLQYTPKSLVEFTYELPYEVIAAREPQIRIFLKGPPNFVFEGVKRANDWHRKAISLENLKITSKATRKQFQDLYQCRLKNGNQNGGELL